MLAKGKTWHQTTGEARIGRPLCTGLHGSPTPARAPSGGAGGRTQNAPRPAHRLSDLSRHENEVTADLADRPPSVQVRVEEVDRTIYVAPDASTIRFKSL